MVAQTCRPCISFQCTHQIPTKRAIGLDRGTYNLNPPCHKSVLHLLLPLRLEASVKGCRVESLFLQHLGMGLCQVLQRDVDKCRAGVGTQKAKQFLESFVALRLGSLSQHLWHVVLEDVWVLDGLCMQLEIGPIG